MADARSIHWRAFRLVALLFLASKLVLLVAARPFMDETYYWLWGQHPALSYFDHPPMVGWTAGLASAFGWNIVTLRLPVLLTLLGDLAVLLALARHSHGKDWRQTFWPMSAIFLSTPIIFGLTNLALPDHLLVFFTLLSIYAFERFRTAFESGVPCTRWLYLTAVAIGLATLSKYTGAFLALGVCIVVAASPRWRQLLRSVHFYLAALLVVAMQAPVILWNLENGLASFDFIVGGRSPLQDLTSLTGLSGYVLGFIFLLSPLMVWPVLRFATARGCGQTLARTVFWLSTVAFLFASLFTNILIHWNIVAYAAVLPFVLPWMRSRLLIYGHFIYGALLAGVMATNFAVTSVQGLFSFTDQATAWSYGWNEVSVAVRRLSVEHGTDLIATTDYALAGPLAFALRDPDVVSLSPRREAFDDWFDGPAHRGQTALIVADRWRPMPAAMVDQFIAMEHLGSLDVTHLGRHVDRYDFYLGRGYLEPKP